MIFTPQLIRTQLYLPGVLTGLLVTCLLLAGCITTAQESTVPQFTGLRHLLSQPAPKGESPHNWSQLNSFYTTEDFRLVWLGDDGPNRRAVLLRERLRQARSEGLDTGHYHTELIGALWSSTDPADRIRLELLLSSAFFAYARDVRSGSLDPQLVAPLWKIETAPVDGVSMLRLSLQLDDFSKALDSLPPSHPVYQRLRQALADYRQIAAQGGWSVIPDGPSLSVGMRDPRVAILRRRLQWDGDLSLPLPVEDELFDEGLAYAVERFQVRHGLQVDGLVGGETLKALNVPVAERIEQIVLNMERWRWLPQYLGRRYLIVNIPAYQLIAYEDGEARLSMPVITGRRDRPTPVASGMLHTLVFNPFWTVPRSIALHDVIPRQRSDPDYMSSHRIRVYSDWSGIQEMDPRQIDWSAINENYFPYMLRQDPGPINALGRIKFLFSNPFEVYLHDTPNKELFAQSVRAYSSGCIRVEEPLQLAAFLLEGQEGGGWSEGMVQGLIGTGQTYELSLSSPIPTYLLYLTVWVGEDGAVHFRKDIYGEDALLAICMSDGEPTC